jgi:transcriptional regulator with XRE-family HTH domain
MTSINKTVGQKLYQMRKHHGLTQMELAEKVGISFQQIQKYEKDVTNISVRRLRQIADALGVNVAVLLEEEAKVAKLAEPRKAYISDAAWLEIASPLNKSETVLLKLFRRISNKKIQEGIIKQMRGIVELERGKKPDPQKPKN